MPVLRREPKRRLASARIFTSYGIFSFLVSLAALATDLFCKQIIAAVFLFYFLSKVAALATEVFGLIYFFFSIFYLKLQR